MFEEFGANQTKANNKFLPEIEFKLFFPGWGKGDTQYAFGGESNIEQIKVFGTFQVNQWEEASAEVLTKGPHKGGNLFSGKIDCKRLGLQPGFYEYRYIVTFKNGEKRIVGDPCTKYSVEGSYEICGFVYDNPDTYNIDKHKPVNIGTRLPLKYLIIYELFIDDFTSNLNGNKALVDKVIDKLDEGYFSTLGINAIEFMPWTGWPGSGFSWGYDNYLFFSVEERYVKDPLDNTKKLDKLLELINKCHEKGIHVIMDCVLNHTYAESRGKGFPYYSLYQNPSDCPFLGAYMEGGFFQDFDYSNECTNLFILDVCKYWIKEYGIDGIRFDYTKGFYDQANANRGLTRLISDLKKYLNDEQILNFSLILEQIDGYNAINVCNKTNADGVWYEPSRYLSYDFLGDRRDGHPQIEPSIMRMLNSSTDFLPDKCPILYHGGNHDHKPLILKAGGRDYWYMIQPYIIAMFTCSGTPLFYNGNEFGQDYDMPESGYGRVVPRPLNWNFKNDDIGKRLSDFYIKMIGIRNNHAGLCSTNFCPPGINDIWKYWDEGWRLPTPDGYGINRNENTVVYHRWGNHKDGCLERFYIILNFNDGKSGEYKTVSFNVADDGPWVDLMTDANATAFMHESKYRLTVNVPCNYGAIYYKKYS